MNEPRFARFADAVEQADSVLEAIRLAVGAASMCWEHVDRAGVFQSDDASAIADVLYASLLSRESGVVTASPTQAAVDQSTANPGQTVYVGEHGPEITRSER